jgi:hypothetical protein
MRLRLLVDTGACAAFLGAKRFLLLFGLVAASLCCMAVASAHVMGVRTDVPGVKVSMHGGILWTGQPVHPGEHVNAGELEILNYRSTGIVRMKLAITLPQEVVDTFQLVLPPHAVKLSEKISGAGKNHMTWEIKNVPPQTESA